MRHENHSCMHVFASGQMHQMAEAPDVAMSTTTLRPSQIPSMWTTWWTSSQIGAIDHMLQNLDEVPERRCRHSHVGLTHLGANQGRASEASPNRHIFA